MAGDIVAIRDEKGRFAKGNRASPGRPKRMAEMQYADRFARAVTPAGFEKAAKKLLEMALNGDVAAIRLLLAYAIGNPVQRIEAKLEQRSVSLEVQAVLDKVYESDGD